MICLQKVANDMRALLHKSSGENSERTRIAGYQVQQTLGVGGMGIVLLAHDPSSQQLVAIKMIRPECRPDQSMIRISPGGSPHSTWRIPNVVPVHMSRSSPTVRFM